MERRRITEYLDADLESERWCCHACGTEIGPLAESYKRGCRVRARDPREIHDPIFEGEFNMAPDPEWCNLVEYYCPSCFVMLEVEYLPPGFPPVHDIELDIEALRAAASAEEGGGAAEVAS